MELYDGLHFVIGTALRRKGKGGREMKKKGARRGGKFLVRGRIKNFLDGSGVGDRGDEEARTLFTRNETRSIYGGWGAVSRESFY